MNGCGKSDGPVVPAKPTNKVAMATAEPVEERGSTKGNTASKTRLGHSAGQDATSALDRVRQVAVRDKQARFTALLHHVDVDRLRYAYRAIKAERRAGGGQGDVGGLRAGPGGQPPWPARAAACGALPGQADQAGVHRRRRTGGYDRSASPRWRTRCSNGPSPGVLGRDLRGGLPWLFLRISSRAWPARRVGRVDGRSGAQEGDWVLDADIRDFFDLWVDWWRHREARGDVIIVRFADDFTVGFHHRDDADRFLTALGDRFAEFGLELHPDKTRLIEFGRYAAERRRARGLGKPETFTSVSRTSVRPGGRGGSGFGARPSRNGCGPSCGRSTTSCSGEVFTHPGSGTVAGQCAARPLRLLRRSG